MAYKYDYNDFRSALDAMIVNLKGFNYDEWDMARFVDYYLKLGYRADTLASVLEQLIDIYECNSTPNQSLQTYLLYHRDLRQLHSSIVTYSGVRVTFDLFLRLISFLEAPISFLLSIRPRYSVIHRKTHSTIA